VELLLVGSLASGAERLGHPCLGNLRARQYPVCRSGAPVESTPPERNNDTEVNVLRPDLQSALVEATLATMASSLTARLDQYPVFVGSFSIRNLPSLLPSWSVWCGGPPFLALHFI